MSEDAKIPEEAKAKKYFLLTEKQRDVLVATFQKMPYQQVHKVIPQLLSLPEAIEAPPGDSEES